MDINGIISGIVVGLVIGALGRFVLPGRQNISILLTLLVGIVAAFIGTAIAAAIGVASTPGIDWIELAIQIVVAAIGVSAVTSLRGSRR